MVDKKCLFELSICFNEAAKLLRDQLHLSKIASDSSGITLWGSFWQVSEALLSNFEEEQNFWQKVIPLIIICTQNLSSLNTCIWRLLFFWFVSFLLFTVSLTHFHCPGRSAAWYYTWWWNMLHCYLQTFLFKLFSVNFQPIFERISWCKFES